MTIQEAAKLAVNVQDACNLSGVVRSFAQVTEVLWHEARRLNQGTDWVNTHPITILFADKVASLAGIGEGVSVFRAYDACIELANAKDSQ